MNRDNIIDEYFEWLVSFISKDKRARRLSYRKLLTYLHTKEFIFIIPRDENRALDGISLRWRFALDMGYKRDFDIIEEYLEGPCSMLEMMIALSLRCEETIMSDPDIGDRTPYWFWDMIFNLGLQKMSDSRFNKKLTNDIVDRFLNREYERNGEGGLFIVDNCRLDLRDIEIWYQMDWYTSDK